jgi:Tol biopolymer transport system component
MEVPMARPRPRHAPALLAIAALVAACAGPPSSATPAATTAAAPAATPTSDATAPSAPTPSPTPIAIQPGEPWIVYQGGTVPRGDTRLRLVRPDGTGDHLLVRDGLPSPNEGHPAWSPAGSRIAFDLWFDVDGPHDRIDLWVVDADGTNARELARCDLPCLQLSYPAWSPDGTEIALNRCDLLPDGTWGPSAVEILDVASGRRRVVAQTADGTSAYYAPRWAPDGRSIALTVETYPDASQPEVTGAAIATVRTDGSDGGAPVVVTPPTLHADQADWTPADRIVFAAAPSTEEWVTPANRLWTVAADGSDLREVPLTPETGEVVGEPTWTAGGSRILFWVADAATGVESLAFVRPDGSDLERLSWTLATPPQGLQRAHAHLRPAP